MNDRARAGAPGKGDAREAEAPGGRFPPWLKKVIPPGPEARRVRQLLADLGLNTVCAGARCPNLPECFARRTATFMILGGRCTRACRFCAVPSGNPPPVRQDEPQAVAEAAVRLGLRHVVITSVTRDDLPDGGAGHFARTIQAVRARLGKAIVEVLTPDFAGSTAAVDLVMSAGPDVFNHNVETVPRLYPSARPQGSYACSLSLLAHAKGATAANPRDRLYAKSGLMLGMGEEAGEVRGVLRDLRAVGCDIVTIGQYLSPSAAHLPVARFVQPGEFDAWRDEAKAMGFLAASAGPFVRSSYLAAEVFRDIAPAPARAEKMDGDYRD